jgi:Helix-turn-helix domain
MKSRRTNPKEPVAHAVPATARRMRPLLTEQDVAALLGYTPQALRNARCNRVGDLATLPWLKIGHGIRYSPDALERWLADRERRHDAERPREPGRRNDDTYC